MLPKFILSLCLALVCCLNVQAQTTKKHKTITNKSTAASLEAYRQNFWNHLPQPSGWTNDFDELFTEEEEALLDGKISLFERETTIQICIVTLDSLCVSAKKFDSLAMHIAKVWGVGVKGKNNGITIVICRDYHKMRICNGNGIKAILSDSQTKEIIDSNFTPNFEKDAYFDGTWNGLNALIAALEEASK